jgi:hypothetical protein
LAGPEPESSFAKEGTDAHRIFATCLEQRGSPSDYTDDVYLAGHLNRALEIARRIIAGRPFKVEIRLDPIPELEKVWGTADVLVFDEDDTVADVIDLKFGVSVMVEPSAVQLRIYALLAAQKYSCSYEGIRLHIVQPRGEHPLGPHRTHLITPDKLDDLLVALEKAVEATEDPEAPRVGGAWCRFCAAKSDCPEAL